MNTQPPKTTTEQAGINQQTNVTSSQQSGTRVQQSSVGTQEPSFSTLYYGTNPQKADKSTQQPSPSSQQSSMRAQLPSSIGSQRASMRSHPPTMNIQQFGMSSQQPSTSAHLPSTSTHLPSTSTHLPSTSTHLPGRSTQQAGASSQQQPSTSTQQPSTSSHHMNLGSQVPMMNLHGHPFTMMSGQPMSGVNMNLNAQQMNMNAQLMNMNLHGQGVPLSMLNMQTPHLNVHGQQLNMAQQPLSLQQQQHMGMTAQQYNMYQIRLHQQMVAQQMYMNQQQQASGSSQPQMSGVEAAAMLNTQATVGEAVPPQPQAEPVDHDKVCQWILELCDPATRENALIELGKRREDIPDLAVLIWHSFGTATALLQEIMSVYSFINPAVLSAAQSNRVCNALALLQCVAANPETRPLFIAAQFPLFLYPLLHTITKSRPFEYLRLTCLGVIGALVKNDEPEVIQYLLDTEIIPLCLRVMECGSELSKIVATFILQKILANEKGLNYVCETYERFSHIAMILGKLVLTLADYPSARLLKHIVRCYLRMSEHPRAKEALRQCLPDQLSDTTFHECLQDEPLTRSSIAQLLVNLEMPPKNYYDPRHFPRSSTSTTPH